MAGVKEEDRVSLALAHTTRGSSLIHPSAWKVASTKFVSVVGGEFSEERVFWV
jgi:hypothetical protein